MAAEDTTAALVQEELAVGGELYQNPRTRWLG